jgi:formylglycine-generating enzyme required for sulfatase activity
MIGVALSSSILKPSQAVETPYMASLRPTTQVSSQDSMVMVYVPAGEFLMGSEKGVNDEKPQHRVTLDAFWIDQTEVTNGMYAKCVADGQCEPPQEIGSSTHSNYYDDNQYADYPVINMDWNKANAYCGWAGRRLPTEAEWEKAARGSDGRTYPWGEQSPTCSFANFRGCEGDTTGVGSYPQGASMYGALDMVGNAWEWVADWYSDTYYIGSPSENPQGPDSGQYRVLRGGSWNCDEWYLRSSNRFRNLPDSVVNDYGFRCVR